MITRLIKHTDADRTTTRIFNEDGAIVATFPTDAGKPSAAFELFKRGLLLSAGYELFNGDKGEFCIVTVGAMAAV